VDGMLDMLGRGPAGLAEEGEEDDRQNISWSAAASRPIAKAKPLVLVPAI
jgi:hypothetical protein